MLSTKKTFSIKGLSENEASERLKKEGYNEISLFKRKTTLKIIFGIITEPMFLLIIACGMIYIFLGDKEEALLLMSFVFVIIFINFYQENKTERAVEALRNLSSPRAVVIRNGEKKRISGREVARGDIILLNEGDRVPADAIILSCSNILVDESLLTGESIPVRKISANKNLQIHSPGGEDLPFVYSGTLVVSGSCIARVLSIGMKTEMGKIGKSLHELKSEKTHLQKENDKLVKNFAIISLFLSLATIFIFGFTRGNWLNGILTGITLAMSILPEEFPVVLTIFLAIGAWRMSKKRVLVRKQQAIQELGSATVLCVDKTGTLTMNKMIVKMIYTKGKFFDSSKKNKLDENFHEIIEFGILASQKDPFDPMEKALKKISEENLSNSERLHKNWNLIHEYPLTRELLSTSYVWESEKNKYIISSKGAPETIIDLCHLNLKEQKKLMTIVSEMSSKGLRVIGVAKAYVKNSGLPTKQHDFYFEFLGFIGFEDPIRPSALNAVKECYNAGIKIIMITGDYPGTAKNIAVQLGLKNPSAIMSGLELNKISDDELKSKISNISIFARVIPDQKLRIVNALKSAGEIVVMTGDGINDAPALKSANIGIAMGERGTDVAREASSVVLTDDDFSSIVEGVKTGRRIFDNIRKAMIYTLAAHVPIAGITLLAVIANWPLLLLPAHIVLLELIIDPSCSIVFEKEPEEKNIMKRKPRNPNEKVLNKNAIQLSLIQGLGLLIIIALIFNFSIFINKTVTEARALTFSALIFGNLCLIITNRSWSKSFFKSLKEKNNSLWLVIFLAILSLILAIYLPFLQEIFKFSALSFYDWLFVLISIIFFLFWFELSERFFSNKF